MRSHLVVAGDKHYWARRGGLGGALLEAANQAEAAAPPPGDREDYWPMLEERLSLLPHTDLQLGYMVNGYLADAVLTTDIGRTAFLLDPGHGDLDGARHLRLQLMRTELLADSETGRPAVRLPAWRLFDGMAP